jgi:hypothetical protein
MNPKKTSLNIFENGLSSITKKGEIESPSLVLDNWWNLSTNLCHEIWYEMVMITWNDEMATCDDDQVLNLEKKKEKQNPMEIKAKV